MLARRKVHRTGALLRYRVTDVAQRVLGIDGDPELIKAFKLPTEEYEKPK